MQPENQNQADHDQLNSLINQLMNMRVTQKIVEIKNTENEEVDDMKWKTEKFEALRRMMTHVQWTNTLASLLLMRREERHPQKDSLQAFHIRKIVKGNKLQDEKRKTKRFIDKRLHVLHDIKDKLAQAREKYKADIAVSKKTIQDLESIRNFRDFDYEENANFFKLPSKSYPTKKGKHIVVYFCAPRNFPDVSFYRSLITINITPKQELDYNFSRLEEEKMSDLYGKALVISLACKKDNKKKALVSFELSKIKKKHLEIEFNLLNIQLFNYLMQIIQFGKLLPSEVAHTKSLIEIECGNGLSFELMYREKNGQEESRERNSYILYTIVLWAVNESAPKDVKTNLREIFGFLGNYIRTKKKLNKLKEIIPGFFYLEEFNPNKLEVLFEVYFNYSPHVSFMVYKRTAASSKKKFFLLRGSKVFIIQSNMGFVTESTIETVFKEELKDCFYVHLKKHN